MKHHVILESLLKEGRNFKLKKSTVRLLDKLKAIGYTHKVVTTEPDKWYGDTEEKAYIEKGIDADKMREILAKLGEKSPQVKDWGGYDLQFVYKGNNFNYDGIKGSIHFSKKSKTLTSKRY